MPQLSEQIRLCIKDCLACYRACVEGLNFCLEQGGPYVGPAHTRILQDGAEMCRVVAELLMRGSEVGREVCIVCTAVCEACAASCDRFEDPAMRECAEQCRRCADALAGI